MCTLVLSKGTYIPLGDHCAPAIILKEIGSRQASFPFDWIMGEEGATCLFTNISLFSRLIRGSDVSSITDEFLQGFLQLPNGQYKNDKGIIFPHEIGSIEDIRIKYHRRFQRLLDTCTVKKRPCNFIIVTRFTIIPHDTLRDLVGLVQGLHPSNKVIVFSGIPHESPDGVLSYYLPYDIEKAYDFDYTTFRPWIREKLIMLLADESECL